MDDLGWRDLGVRGSEFYETPHIDRMAEEGMQFTRAYAAGPLCAPSRGAILSGKYPAQTKFTSVVSNAPDDALDAQSKALGVANRFLEAPTGRICHSRRLSSPSDSVRLATRPASSANGIAGGNPAITRRTVAMRRSMRCDGRAGILII